MIQAFNSGMGCLEFTKSGNCHYHLKTQDDISDIHVFLDKLKGIRTVIDGKKTFVFGFVQCDKTKNVDMIGNYDYIEKSHLSVEQTLKKLGLSDKYKALWIFKPRTTTFNTISRSRAANKDTIYRNLSQFIDLDDTDNDTLENLIIHNKN